MDKIRFGFFILGIFLLPAWIFVIWWLITGEYSEKNNNLGNISFSNRGINEGLKVGDVLSIDLSKRVVCSENKCWNVKLATNISQWQKGLQGVDFLTENSGMLFVFPFQKEWKFWMSGTLITLDIIWIDQNGRITKIWKGAKPCNNKDCEIQKGIGKYVLEIKSR